MAAYDQLFSGSAVEIAASLVKSLKSKDLAPDDVFQAYTELFPEYHETGADLVLYFTDLVQALSEKDAPAGLGRSLIAAIRYFRGKEDVSSLPRLRVGSRMNGCSPSCKRIGDKSVHI